MSTRPRLCFVWTAPDLLHYLLGEAAPIGGAELQMRKLGRRLQDMGWDISFVVSDCDQGDAVVNEDGFTLYSSYPFRRVSPVADILATKMPRVGAAMHRADADVFVQRGAAWLTGHCANVAHRMQRGFVFWIASLKDTMAAGHAWKMPPHVRMLYLHGMRQADLIVAQTQEQAALIEGRFRKPALVLPNICPVPTEVSPKGEAPAVLWVGNIAARKRPGMLLEIARLCPSLAFTMVGGPSPGEEAFYDQTEAQAAEVPNVRFLGALRPEEVEVLYGRAWVLVSTSDSEGFSNVFLQAWACRTPVVAFLDPDEVICRYHLGYHCSTEGEMAERVQQLCADGALRAQLGSGAREYVREHHAPAVVMPQLDAQLRGLMRERRA